MAIQLIARVTAVFVPDGIGGMSVESDRTLTLTVDFGGANIGPVAVPGGNRPSTANIATALNALATNLAAIFGNAANLAIIGSWGPAVPVSSVNSGGGGGGYTTGAVHFAGAASEVICAALTATDSGVCSFAWWYQYASDQNSTELYTVDEANLYLSGGEAEGPPQGNIKQFWFDATRASSFNYSASAESFGFNQWHSIIGSVKTDLGAGSKIVAVYADDTLLTFGNVTDASAAFNIAFNGLSFSVGDDSFGDGAVFDCADFWFAPNQSLLVAGDIPLATRRKFRDGSGKPVNLGATGSTPTGVAPAVFLRRAAGAAASTFATNLGTGGNFTGGGSITNAATSPSD